jgi:(1->4)-alpha-D-glucan 1-alpha-D-glucosylmutase
LSRAFFEPFKGENELNEQDERIAELAAMAGIADHYEDSFGNLSISPPSTVRALLRDFGFGVDSPSETAESHQRLRNLRRAPLAPLNCIEAGNAARVALRIQSEPTTVEWRLTVEWGSIREGIAKISYSQGEGTLELPPLPMGYHRLTMQADGASSESVIIASPKECWEPDEIRDHGQLWGASAQTYGLRSAKSLGIGDFSDIGHLAQKAAALGASFLGLSPAHAMFSSDRAKFSLYAPSSRLFLDPIYLDISAIEGFAGTSAARLLTSSEMSGQIAALQEAPLVDYAAAWAVKVRLLNGLWREIGGRENIHFDRFRRERGAALSDHATFDALFEHFQAQGRWWVGEWPQALRSSHSEEVSQFRANAGERIAFYAWLQYLCDAQLAGAARRARASGMSLGLYRDLAVSVDRGGSEVWAAPEAYALSSAIGAPPDLLAPQGQDWGLPPFNPIVLERTGLQAFRAPIVANMRHAGAIRIDHAFQLRRLYLVPLGAPPNEGAYVSYPFEAMLAVLRIESWRARCVVIAEDLGNAPSGFSEAIMRSGVSSYRVMPFEREQDGALKPPASYPRRAVAVLSTHDLPTFAGWWRGVDIDVRHNLAIYDLETARALHEARRADCALFCQALAREKLIPEGEVPLEPPIQAAIAFLGLTKSALVSLQVEDAIGELNQANLPGVSDEAHPNWRRRLSLDVETMFEPGGGFAGLSAILAGTGRDVRKSGSLATAPPRSTYRLQMHRDFGFDKASRTAPYLAKLGISHVYLSPIQTSQPGSTHGYDTVDHGAINPELGGLRGFYRFSDALQAAGLGLIVDIVPNHAGIGGSNNSSWLSVLEWGALSPLAHMFDIDWNRILAAGKLVVPFLGSRYGLALERGEIRLAFDRNIGGFNLWHHEHQFPICPLQYPEILDSVPAILGARKGARALRAISERLRAMSLVRDTQRRLAFPDEANDLKLQLKALAIDEPSVELAIERSVAVFNGVAGDADTFGMLHRLIESQPYRLSYWRVAESDLNYRRFFDIATLAGIRAEDPDIFERTHREIIRLIKEKRIDGLRIDHVDGLADPEGYLKRLQNAVGPGFYIVVEKILEPGEALRAWPISGTTGYEALNLIDGVFVDSASASHFTQYQQRYAASPSNFHVDLRTIKTEILRLSFGSEFETLTSKLKAIADGSAYTRDFTRASLSRVLAAMVSELPVYRSYLTDGEPSVQDLQLIGESAVEVKKAIATPDIPALDFFTNVLVGAIESDGVALDRTLFHDVRRLFQQLSGPVMAKSLEDTLFYRDTRLVALNEVGGDPTHFGVSLAEFHAANITRQRNWPHSMVATETHDSKRGEDFRARLIAISEIPEEWEKIVKLWYQVPVGHGGPDENDRYFMLQTIVGAWPMKIVGEPNPDEVAAFVTRLEAYLVKSLREAKRHSSWLDPNNLYEETTLAFLRSALAPDGGCLAQARSFVQKIAPIGMLNSVSRLVLKCTIPGIPDTYQGTEFWDFSLVDPDNRRPVDFELRAQLLTRDDDPGVGIENWTDGGLKQRLLARLLADRESAPEIYSSGDYRPIFASGDAGQRVIAYSRNTKNDSRVILAARLFGPSSQAKSDAVGDAWSNTFVSLRPGLWRDLLTGRECNFDSAPVALSTLFSRLQVAVLKPIEASDG